MRLKPKSHMNCSMECAASAFNLDVHRTNRSRRIVMKTIELCGDAVHCFRRMFCRALALDVSLARLCWMFSEKYYFAYKSLGVTLFIKFYFIFNANTPKASCVVCNRSKRRLKFYAQTLTPQITKRHQIFFAGTRSLCGNVVRARPANETNRAEERKNMEFAHYE